MDKSRDWIVCFGLALAMWFASSAIAGPRDGRLDFYWIDVEGGAATLIVTPQGESILIDTGHPGHHDGDRIVRTVVQEAGLRRVDHVVVTHYHLDHYGGVATLATMLPLGAIYDNGEFPALREPPPDDYRQAPCDRRVVLSPGDALPLRAAAPGQLAPGQLAPRIVCLAARQEMIAPPVNAEANSACQAIPDKPKDDTDNANSIVLKLSFGRFDFFAAGDLTWNVERKLVDPVNLVGTVDVYQATHHGLDASNHPCVIRALQPTVAVMSNGHTKGCEPQTFTTLRETTQAIYQVHKNLRDDRQHNTGDECIANHEKECRGNLIHLSVDADGAAYVVRVPSSGRERRFESR